MTKIGTCQGADAQRQKCKSCGRPDKFDFHVPDKIWNAVVPVSLRNRVVCLSCFDGFAKKRGVEYAPYVRILYFVGDAANLRFETAARSR